MSYKLFGIEIPDELGERISIALKSICSKYGGLTECWECHGELLCDWFKEEK